MQTAKLKMGK